MWTKVEKGTRHLDLGAVELRVSRWGSLFTAEVYLNRAFLEEHDIHLDPETAREEELYDSALVVAEEYLEKIAEDILCSRGLVEESLHWHRVKYPRDAS